MEARRGHYDYSFMEVLNFMVKGKQISGILNRENCVHHKGFKRAVCRIERRISVESSAQRSSQPVTALINHRQCNTSPTDFIKMKFLFTSSPKTESVMEYNCNLDALKIDENSNGC
jgi:hypothetical protein